MSFAEAPSSAPLDRPENELDVLGSSLMYNRLYNTRGKLESYDYVTWY